MAALCDVGRPTFKRVKECIEENKIEEMKTALQELAVATEVRPFSIHKCLKQYWKDQPRQEIVKALLDWGTMAQKFALFKYTINIQALQRESGSPSSIRQKTMEDVNEEVDDEIIALKIVSVSPDLILVKSAEDNTTVMHLALEYGSEKAVTTLIQLAKDKHYKIGRLLDACNKQNKTPLMLAVNKGSIEMVHTILRSFPEIQVGKNLIDQAIDNGQQDVLFILIQFQPSSVPKSLLEYSLRLDQLKLLREVLARYKELFYGHALLHCAIRQKNVCAVDLLLASCPEIAVEQDKEGRSALHCLKEVEDIEARKDLRKLIAPRIIRQITSSPKGPLSYQSIPQQIRRHLADNEGIIALFNSAQKGHG